MFGKQHLWNSLLILASLNDLTRNAPSVPCFVAVAFAARTEVVVVRIALKPVPSVVRVSAVGPASIVVAAAV